MTRTEAWTKTEDGYTTTAVIPVQEMVEVSIQAAEMLGLPLWHMRGSTWYPYADVAAALAKDGRTLKGEQ